MQKDDLQKTCSRALLKNVVTKIKGHSFGSGHGFGGDTVLVGTWFWTLDPKEPACWDEHASKWRVGSTNEHTAAIRDEGPERARNRIAVKRARICCPEICSALSCCVASLGTAGLLGKKS